MTNSRPSSTRHLRSVLPFWVPVITVTAILAVLFAFGVREQDRLRSDHIERVLGALEQSEQQVAEDIRTKLAQAERSLARYQDSLSRALNGLDSNQIQREQQHFQRLTERYPDGSIRSRRAGFDASRDAGIAVPKRLQPDPHFQALLARAKTLTDAFGRGAQENIFVDTWWLAAPGGEVLFGPTPDMSEFTFQADADFDYLDTDWMQLAHPQHNPQGALRWTPLAFDPTPKIWMFSCVLPLTIDGEWRGSVGHDVPLGHLLRQAKALSQVEGSAFVLVTADDRVVASDHFADAIIASEGKLTLAELDKPLYLEAAREARAAFQLSRGGDRRVLAAEQVAFVSHFPAQDWLLINVVPLAPITGPVQDSFTRLRNLTVLALLLELIVATGMLWWNHRQSRRSLTELIAVHDALSDREQRLSTLIANLPGVVYRRRGEAHAQADYISPMIEVLSGYPAEKFLAGGNRTLASLIHPADREEAERELRAACTSGMPYLLEYRLVQATGAVRWVQDRGRPVYDSQGQLQRIEGVMFDISEQRETSEQLKHINEQLERLVEARTADLQHSNAELEAFTYTVSHDLRAPVRHVSGYLQLLRDELGHAISNNVADLLQRIERSGQRMSSLIDGLLSLSRLGSAAVRWGNVDLDALVADICAEFDDGRVQWQRAPLGHACGDPLLLRQVLQNLISNAVKYSARETAPLVSIQSRPDLAHRRETVLEVADNGVGFDPSYADKLFKVFQRLHPGAEFSGEGIGLATVAKIVHLHGGRVWAESEPGAGARFFLTLPTEMPTTPRDG